jgi:hypothetical protein
MIFFHDLSSMQMNLKIIVIVLVAGMLSACAPQKSDTEHRKALASLFDRASSVRILSYINRPFATVVIDEEEVIVEPKKDTTHFRAADLEILESTIQERLTLTPQQTVSLYSLLDKNSCETTEVAACYDPRHAIVFFDATGHPFSYIEVCFDCMNYQTPEDVSLDLCSDQFRSLAQLFRSFEIKYFGAAEF